jgi:hypothetical protein
MKTAMQELIEELRQTRDEGESEYKTAYNLAIAIANQYFEKEKEQILNAYVEGCFDNILDETTDKIRAEFYYAQTYNQNPKPMKQTAVEWLVEQIKGYEYDGNDFVYNGVISSDLIEEAKEMEKEQIENAFEDGEHNYFYSKKTGEDFENGIEYYNEKFKKDEQ